MNSDSYSPWRWLQFSVRSLLLIVLCISCILWAYHAGYRAGLHEPRNVYTVVKAYDVKDLVFAQGSEPSDLKRTPAKLIKQVQSHVQPDTWTPRGSGQIEYFAPNYSLVVVTRPDVHDTIEEFLQAMRRGEMFDHTRRNILTGTAIAICLSGVAMSYYLVRKRNLRTGS